MEELANLPRSAFESYFGGRRRPTWKSYPQNFRPFHFKCKVNISPPSPLATPIKIRLLSPLQLQLMNSTLFPDREIVL